MHLLGRFEGFRPTPYFDVDKYRGGYGSDTYTKEDGTVVNVTKESVISREDAERDLRRRTDTEFMPRLAKALGPKWDTLTDIEQGALSSMVYRYGSPKKEIVTALQTGGIPAAVKVMQTMDKAGGGDRNNIEAAILGGNTDITVGGKPLFSDNDEVQYANEQSFGADPLQTASTPAAYGSTSLTTNQTPVQGGRPTQTEFAPRQQAAMPQDTGGNQDFSVPVSPRLAEAMARILNVPIEELGNA
jgi:GH24 family phage-related lysozyme (muramidase)